MPSRPPPFRDRQGKPISRDQWVEFSSNDTYRVLAVEVMPLLGIKASTIWVGFDMTPMPLAARNHEPIIFETAVLPLDVVHEFNGMPLRAALYQRRYATEAAAYLGHGYAISVAQQMFSAGKP